MASTWIRRDFASPGLTQHPVGAHLSALQDRLSGSVVLCLDVSSSMSGSRIGQAVKGALRFVDEATEASYQVGVVLWNQAVASSVSVGAGSKDVKARLKSASPNGGTNVVPALKKAEGMLESRTGDLVVAVFGDGDLGDRAGAMAQAAKMRAKNIRIITCGLDGSSAESLDEISTEDRDRPRSAGGEDVADAVAGLASGLRRR